MNKKHIKIVILIFFIISNSILILPRNINAEFEKLSLEKGVPLNLTYCMIQDRKGFLWFGTMYGLVKYDGREYTVYKNDPDDSTSISFDDIISLYEDKDGNIWVGTWGGGLNKLNPLTGNFKRYLYNPENKNGINDNIIWSITQDNSGNIWLGTQTGGLNKLNFNNNIFTHYNVNNSDSSQKDNSVRVVYKDTKGNVWAGTNYGLAKYLPGKDNLEFYKHETENKNSLSSNAVTSIYEDKNGNLWIGTLNGINKFDREKTFSLIDLNSGKQIINGNVINSIYAGHKNNLWIGTQAGLVKYNPSDNTIQRYTHDSENLSSLSGNFILNVLEDKSGVIWVNAYQTGINKLINRDKIFQPFLYNPANKAGLNKNSVFSFKEDSNGNIWLGTLSGLKKYNPVNNVIMDYSLKSNSDKKNIKNLTHSLEIDNQNNLWLGTNGGLLKFDLTKDKYSPLPKEIANNPDLSENKITSILFNGKEKLWIGTYQSGLFLYNLNDKTLEHFSNKNSDFNSHQTDFILTIYKDRSDQIWIGTYGGLLKYNNSDNKFTAYVNNLNDPKSLSNNYVYCIYQDNKQNLWVGTSNGLNLYNKNENNFKHYFEKDGLPNNIISGIIENDKDIFWLSTLKGISKFNFADKTFRNFTESEGLQSNQFLPGSYFKSQSNKLYFGGINGFNSFYPDSLIFSKFDPSIYITSFKSSDASGNSKIYSMNNNIKLDYDENFITIRYAALDYTNPDKIKYSFKLSGVDKKWINADNKNSADYTNLSPGSYIFLVKSTNSEGQWNNNLARISFTILPPFWQTWWFITLCALAFLFIVYIVHLIKVRYEVRKAVEIAKARIDEAEKVRRKTALDFHDELGHRLTRISVLTEIVKQKIGDIYTDATPLLDKISENSKMLYDGTKDFIWAIDPKRDSLYELLIRLKDFGDEIFSDSNIEFQVKGLEEEFDDVQLTMDWKRHLAMIFKEAMNNALKHSNSRQVFLEISFDWVYLDITLTDDGNGFDQTEILQGNGLQNMKSRARRLFGSLEVESNPGIGTKISFKGKIPKKSLHFV